MQTSAESSVSKSLDRLVSLSEDKDGDFLSQFNWTPHIDDSEKWISDELLTIYNTDLENELSKKQINLLRKWESINFYSQNIHGEKTLSQDMMSRIYDSRYLKESSYIYHFIKEENEHMAMFAEFCKRYGEIFPNSRIDLGRRQKPLIEELLLFSRTILFEFYVDYYNRTAGADESLPSIVREINKYHHVDEARHILFSNEMIKSLYENIKREHTENEVDEVGRYIEEYMINQIELVYSTKVYEMAGIKKPSEFRKRLLQHPGRRKIHLEWINQPYSMFRRIGIFGKRTKEEIIDGYFLPQKEQLEKSALKDPKSALREWLIEQSGNKDMVIEDDFDILDSGIVDSLKFMRFIMFIEKVSGNEMRLDEIDLNDIRSISAIENAFL